MPRDVPVARLGSPRLCRRSMLGLMVMAAGTGLSLSSCGQPTAPPNQGAAQTTGSTGVQVVAAPTTVPVGASGATAATAAQATVPPGGKTVEIVFWPRSPSESSVVWEKILPIAKQMAPDLTVKLEAPPSDYNNKLLVAYAGGSAPDSGVTGLSAFRAFIGKKMFRSIQSYIDADADVHTQLKDYVPAAIAGYSYQGKLYAAPTVNEAIVLFYNADAIKEAGLAPPRDIQDDPKKWNWDTVVTYAKAITKGTGPRRERFGIICTSNKGPTSISEGWGNLVYARGGRFLDESGENFTFNTPETQDALQWIVDLTFKHDVMPNVADSASASLLDRAYFQNGQLGMVVQGEYFSRYLWGTGKPSGGLRFNYDLVPMPFCPATGKRTNIYHGNGSFMVSQTKNPQATWEWLKVIFSKPAQEVITTYWGTRAANEGTYASWLQSNAGGGPPGLNYQAIIKADQGTVSWPTTPYLTPEAEMEPTTRIMFDDVFQNKMTVTAGLNQIATETIALLKKGKQELAAVK